MRLSICKREETLDTPVEGARYGLYADTGELLAEAVTDEQGMISYVGDPSSGFILANNCLYYVQEIEAPFGYALSDTRYWFYYDDSRQGRHRCLAGKREDRRSVSGVRYLDGCDQSWLHRRACDRER